VKRRPVLRSSKLTKTASLRPKPVAAGGPRQKTKSTMKSKTKSKAKSPAKSPTRPAAKPAAKPALATGPAPVVLWLAAEAVPWANTGGLGDVVGSLPAVLRARGWDVRLCLPLYADARKFPVGPVITKMEIPVGHGRHRVGATIREAVDPPGGVPTYLVESPLFDRRGIYGADGEVYPDNPFRFGVWQLAARELASTLEPAPAIIHCHDWHAALCPALVKLPGQWPIDRRDVRTIFTIHNLEFQGHTDPKVLQELELPRELWHPHWLEHFGGANFVKGAILSADRITTVSRTYADEIRTPRRGCGLDGPLRERGQDVTGIVNGIDVGAWDPGRDHALLAPFDAEHRAGRGRNKTALRIELEMTGTEQEPLLGFIGRLTDSKGVDILIEAAPKLLALGANVVVLGTGDRHLERALEDLERKSRGRFRAVLRFDAALARRIYAGVDVMIVPSRIEPCGLVQLYALRYGAVPVVHAVGGLRDTVRDGETGFAFEEPTVEAMVAAVRRALVSFADRRRWSKLVAACMRQDWSWGQSAAGYDALYRDVLAKPARHRPLPAPEDDQAQFVDYGPELPERLGQETLQLLAQGPRSLYMYWETSQAEPLTVILEERPTANAFVLSRELPSVGEFWVPSLPEHAYRASLVGRDGTVIRVSNLVVTGRDSPAAAGEQTPVWLERLLADGSVDDPRAGDRWATVFTEPLHIRHGMPPRDRDSARPGGAPSSLQTSGLPSSGSHPGSSFMGWPQVPRQRS
jgi:starch synthase